MQKNFPFGKTDLRIGSATKDKYDEFTCNIFVHSDVSFLS